MQPHTIYARKKKQKLCGITNENFNVIRIRPQSVVQVTEVVAYISKQHRLKLSKKNDFKRAYHLITQMGINN
jgi:hypothetical protein